MSAVSVFTKLKDISRLRQILTVLAKYGYGHIIQRLGIEESKFLSHVVPKSTTAAYSHPERLRRALEELGPTFIKLGQILSTRTDLIPPAYIDEFSKLQDDVAPFSMSEVAEQFRLEVGEEITNAFSEFNPIPIASASLSQVHRAVLKDGRQVAVKVQRPGIKPLIEGDIDLLYLLSRLIVKSIPELGIYSPIKLVREFERAIMKELDFTIEAANCERFSQNFRSEPDINFPKVHPELSGKKVLTMDFVEGVKITDYRLIGLDPKPLARLGLRAVVEMVFRDGFFHADPHPGNVFVSDGPTITFLDLGLAGRVGGDVKDRMLLLMLAITREDFQEVVDILFKIGIKQEEVDLSEFREDVLDICEKHFGRQLKYMEFRNFMKDILEGAFRHKIRIPHDYALMCKAIMTMEGVGKTLDPDLNIFEEAHPLLVDIFKHRYSIHHLSKDLTKAVITISSVLQEAPPKIKNILDSLEEGKFKLRIEDLRPSVTASMWERVINRIIMVILAGLIVAASFVLILGVGTGLAKFFGVLGIATSIVLTLSVIFSILRSGS